MDDRPVKHRVDLEAEIKLAHQAATDLANQHYPDNVGIEPMQPTALGKTPSGMEVIVVPVMVGVPIRIGGGFTLLGESVELP